MQGMHFSARLAMAAAAATAAMGTGACVSEPGEPEADLTEAANTNEGGGTGDDSDPCPLNGCGGNSPVIAGVYFGQIHLGGTKNEEHVQLTGVTAGDGETPLQLELAPGEGDRLRAWNGATLLEHQYLNGVKLHVQVNGHPYVIQIRSVGTEAFWAGSQTGGGSSFSPLPPPPPVYVETYEFLYHPLGHANRSRPLCSEHASGRMRAIAFGGDTYRPDTKAITIGAATAGWVNLACEGSAVFKMHMVGYTTAAEARLGIATTLPQRQAMLNAWTSNVCGTGRSFTHQGVPIALVETHHVLPSTSPYNVSMSAVEAIWNELGAVCLGTHRMQEEEPLVVGAIQAVCAAADHALPPCDSLVLDWAAHGSVMTGIPSP